jgi:hypothetical protein
MRQLRDPLRATLLLLVVMVVNPLPAGSQTASAVPPAASPPAASPPAASPPPAAAPTATAPVASPPSAPVLAANEIQGLNVFGSDGRQVGKIAKVNVTGGAVKDVEVRSGGFLGFFSKTYLLPAEKLNKKGGRVELSMTSAQARQYIK